MKKKEVKVDDGPSKGAFDDLQSHLLAVRSILDDKFDLIGQLEEQRKEISHLSQEKQNLLNAMKVKDEEFQVAQQRLLERNQEVWGYKKTISDLDAKIKAQLSSIGKLKEELLETSKKLKTYIFEMNPLKEKVVELQAENRDIKNSLEQKEKDLRKLFLDLSAREKEPKQEQQSYEEKLKQLQEAHEEKLKGLIAQYTQENLQLGSQISQLKRELARRDHILREIAKIQADVANKLLNNPL